MDTDKLCNDTAEVTGEVFAADVQQGRCRMRLDDGLSVEVTFTDAQEGTVTTALKDHRSVGLEVRGRGEFSPSGRLLRIGHVERLRVVPIGERTFDPSARSIEDEIAELVAGVSLEAWNDLPDDLSENLDHYLYGAPKQ